MSAADDSRAEAWPNRPRGADVRTSVPSRPVPPSLDDPAQVRALQAAHQMGFLEGQARSEQQDYTAGWRVGVVCGFVAGAIVFCGIFKLGYLAGLAQ